MQTTAEKLEVANVTYLGRMEDLGIGNPEGIPSKLADASETELQEFGEMLKQLLSEVTDTTHFGCIDGRCRLCNADGSAPDARLRHVSGTGSNLEIALNAGASVADVVADMPLDQAIKVVEDDMTSKTGVKRSAHSGGCGGVNGAVADNEAIGAKPAILKTTETFMSLPTVQEATGVEYAEELGEAVRENAPRTAFKLREGGWTGEKYVEGVRKDEPAGLEDLEVDRDHPFHGHAEDAIVFVLGKKTITTPNLFVINLDAIIMNADALSDQRGRDGYIQALIADIAKHIATADRLASKKTPIYLVEAA